MPIYDHSYRHLERPLPPPVYRWAIIARLGIVERLRRRWFDALLIVAYLPFLYYAVRLFLELKLPDIAGTFGADEAPREIMGFVSITPASFLQLLRAQVIFAFLVTIFAGSGLISGDLRTRALPLYLSKPITRLDYVLGKLIVSAFFIATVTLLPAMLLLILRIATSEGFSFFTGNPLLPLRITLASGLMMLVMSLLMLALSSLSRSSWLPGLGFAIAYLFGRAFSGLLRLIFRSDTPILLSLRDNLLRVADAIFGTPPASGPSWLLSLGLLFAVAALSAVVLHARIRGVEVVAS